MLIHFEENHPVNKADSGDRPVLNGKSASGGWFPQSGSLPYSGSYDRQLSDSLWFLCGGCWCLILAWWHGGSLWATTLLWWLQLSFSGFGAFEGELPCPSFSRPGRWLSGLNFRVDKQTNALKGAEFSVDVISMIAFLKKWYSMWIDRWMDR